ncbi:MAG: type II secretion system F family protein [Steroidobacteraceae bacterium]|nr:type II secretion system F family protein [Steroidobacteraceae bacterium]
MGEFSYKGRSRDGKLVNGRAAGESVDQVAQRLVATGVIPLQIEALGAVASSVNFEKLGRRIGLGGVTTTDLVMFSRQMYTITRAGIPLLRGLRGLVASTHNAILRETLEDILESLEGGRDLAASFARHPQIFPTLYVSIVSVGEATGTLDKSFLRLTEYLSQEQKMHDSVKGAVRYPIIVMITIAFAVGFISTFVIPKFAPVFAQLKGDLPLPTRLLLGSSSLVRDYWMYSLSVVAVCVFGVRRYLQTQGGRYKWDRFKLRIPVMGKLMYEAMLSRLNRSMAISLAAGMPMTQTLAVIARSSGNVFVSEKIRILASSVERGESLHRSATASGMFSPLVLQMIAIGEETGALPELLDEAASYYEREVDHAVKNLSSSIEPILIVAVGGMVLILALGIFMPLWEVISKAGQA